MKIINPYISPISIGDKYNILNHVDICYSTIYNKPNCTNDTEQEELLYRLIKEQDYNILSHIPIYLKLPVDYDISNYDEDVCSIYTQGVENTSLFGTTFISCTLSYIVLNELQDDLKYMSDPQIYHDKITSMIFVVDGFNSSRIIKNSESFAVSCRNPFSLKDKNKKFTKELTFIDISDNTDLIPKGKYTTLFEDSKKIFKHTNGTIIKDVEELDINDTNFTQSLSREDLIKLKESFEKSSRAYRYLIARSNEELRINELIQRDLFTPSSLKNNTSIFRANTLIITNFNYAWIKLANHNTFGTSRKVSEIIRNIKLSL